MRRRDFITPLGGAAAWPLVAKAQPTGKSWRIGQATGGSAETNGHFARALEQRLGELGYQLGVSSSGSVRIARVDPWRARERVDQ
jgi:putative tryptophan/tyrosine transport system substrate-binding protein